MNQGLTTIQAAEVVGRLRWMVDRLAEILGSWAGEADATAAVSLATVARHLDWHTNGLDGLQPDYEAVNAGSHTGPARPEMEVALAAIGTMTGSLERLAVTHRVLLEWLSTQSTLVDAETADHCDAALIRALGFLEVDLRRDRRGGEALLQRLLTDEAATTRVGNAVTAAQRHIAAAGGVFPVASDSGRSRR